MSQEISFLKKEDRKGEASYKNGGRGRKVREEKHGKIRKKIQQRNYDLKK